MIVYCPGCRTRSEIDGERQQGPIDCEACGCTIGTLSDLAGAPRLLVIGPDKRRDEYHLGVPISIGRDPSCLIHIPEDRVSRIHAKIVRREGRFYVEDAGSRNGTLLNGDRLVRAEALMHADQLQIGSTIMRYYEFGDDDPRSGLVRTLQDPED